MKIEFLCTPTSKPVMMNKNDGEIRDSGRLGVMIPMDVRVEIPRRCSESTWFPRAKLSTIGHYKEGRDVKQYCRGE